jgi:hypothetical protein
MMMGLGLLYIDSFVFHGCITGQLSGSGMHGNPYGNRSMAALPFRCIDLAFFHACNRQAEWQQHAWKSLSRTATKIPMRVNLHKAVWYQDFWKTILIMNFVFVYFTFPPNIFHCQRAKSRLTHLESIFLETQCAFSNNTYLINSC